MESGAGEPDAEMALAMLDAFASVGTSTFDLTLLDLDGREREFRRGRSLDELRRFIGRQLEAAAANRHSVVIRPRSMTSLLIQLDDFSAAQAEKIAPLAFMTVCTSPANYQVWLAVADGPRDSEREAAKLFRTRVRRGAGADHSATGATRIAGSINFKAKYAPAFPRVAIAAANSGRLTTVAALAEAGLIAPEPAPPAACVPRSALPTRPAAGRQWPNYQQALRGAPRKSGGEPDRSLADFMWSKWAVQRGWSVEETAAKLTEVSAKAQERLRIKTDAGYALLTARNAAAAVERDRGHRQSLRGAAGPAI